MDIHHRRSPSSDRFLGLSSDSSRRRHFSSAAAAAAAEEDELHESDFLWTATATAAESDESNRSSRRKLGFRQNSGLLTATAAATPARAIPKPQRELVTESATSRKFRNSAPISVPPPPAAARRRLEELDGLSVVDSSDEEEEMMLPPHEMVAMKLKTTSHSVLEGAGRTLKGRDLRQVRNAVWRQTGFLD